MMAEAQRVIKAYWAGDITRMQKIDRLIDINYYEWTN